MNSGDAVADEVVGDLISEGPHEVGKETAEDDTKRNVVPTLVVGLGGTGAQVVSRLKRKLQTHFGSADLRAEMIKFLVLDTIALAKQSDKDIREVFSEADEEYLSLADGFNAFAYLQQNYSRDRDLRNWWDNRYTVSPQYQEWGAKRVRQLGRLFLHHKHLHVESTIQNKVADTSTLYEELVRGQNLADVGANFRVYLVTSTCGGTGSGIFVDVLYKIWRAVLSQGKIPEVRAFMFMPGIYEEEARKRSLELVEAHRANAYAFLKEVDFLITPGVDPSNYILDSETRDSSQKIKIPAGSLFKYGYLIDKQLGNLGNLDRPEDAYDLTADAMYQMAITPVGQEEEGVGLTNIDAIVDPAHTREGKRTAYSSLGLSRILFPRDSLQSHLTFCFIRDIVFSGFLSSQSWIEEAVRKDNRLTALVRRIGEANLDALERAAAPALEIVTQCPSQADLQSSDMSERLDSLVREKEANVSRVAEALLLIDRQYMAVLGRSKAETLSAMTSLVNNCEFGLVYSRRILALAKRKLRAVLDDLGDEARQYQQAAADAERNMAKILKTAESLLSRRAVLMKARKINRLSAAMANQVRAYVEASLLSRMAEKKESLLQALAGDEQVIEERLDDKEIVTERIVSLSVLDESIKAVGKIIDSLSELGTRAETRAKEPAYSQSDEGATITTQVFPRRITEYVKSSSFRAMYESRVSEGNIHKHVATILSRLEENSGLKVAGLYDLCNENRARAVKRRLVSCCSDYVGEMFHSFLGQSLVEVVERSVGSRRFREQIVANLFELSQPCWNYDTQMALDPGFTELPRTYSLGYRSPESLPMPRGRQRPGLVRTEDDHQVTLLQAQHGLPLFALRVLPVMRADYRKWMRIAKRVGSQPLHIHQDWGRNIDAIPDLKVSVEIADEVLLDFSLALFSDYLVTKKDPLLTKMIVKRPIYSGPVRGFLFSSDGRQYFLSKLKVRGDNVELRNVENISTTGRLDAAEAYAKHADASREISALLRIVEQAKQYELIPQLEGYLNTVLVPEVRQVEDEEERQILEREYAVLNNYLDGLRRQQQRGLPLAG